MNMVEKGMSAKPAVYKSRSGLFSGDKSVMIRCLIRDRQLYLMIFPMLLFFLIFCYKPMIGLVIAFKDYSPFKGIWNSPWVGFRNFTDFFGGPYFMRTLANTLVISMAGIVIGFPIPIILALLFNEIRSRRLVRTVQTITYAPHFISAVVIAGLVTNFLAPTSGLFNVILERLGAQKIHFLAQPEYFVPIYTLMDIWQNAGFNTILYISALTGIGAELYEAAIADGAGRWRQLLHITLPGMLPTIVIMLILRLGGILNVGYETIILLYNPGTYSTADVISTYVYRSGIEGGKYDFATAVGLFNSTVGFIMVIVTNKISNKVADIGLW